MLVKVDIIKLDEIMVEVTEVDVALVVVTAAGAVMTGIGASIGTFTGSVDYGIHGIMLPTGVTQIHGMITHTTLAMVVGASLMMMWYMFHQMMSCMILN